MGDNMKKGFTLIEIIGIIILLSLIGLLVYPTIMRIIGDSKEDLYQKNISEIERMAANWASINEDKLPKVDKRGYYLKIEEMEKEGFIDGDVTNPKTGEAMQGCVGIIYNEEKNRHDYKYYDDCENFVKPILSNLVANVVENEYGWRNKDFYVTLESEYLDYYDYCISDDKCEPSIRSNESNSPILVNQEGIKYVCAKGANTVGETTTECLKYRLDKTKPVVGNIVFTGTQGLDNWYIGDVLVSNTKSTDALSGIASNTLSPTETSITVDTKGKTYTLTARDLAGNESSVSYTVKVDKTAPTVGELVINGTLGDNDWYKSNVTFSVKDGSDATSGHGSTTSSISSITSDTKGTKVVVTTVDKAGNRATKEYTVKVDKTPPVPGTLVVEGTKGFGEWYISSLTLKVNNGSDATSGHASTTSSISSITANTTGTEVIVTTVDKAGNSATRKYTLKVNKDKPTAGTLVIDGTLGENGWYVSNVNLSVKDVSGVTSKLDITKITSDTKGTEVTMTSTNNETGAVTVTKHTIKVDKTKPTVGELVITGTLGSNSWYTSNVTFSVKNGSDALSGHGSTTSSISSITANTKGTNVVVTTKDKAGNKATKTYTVKVDKTKPTITAKYTTITIGSISETNVSDLFTTSYSISGGSIKCDVAKTANIKGANNPLKCTATGGNGLTASASITVKNPLVSIAVTKNPNKMEYRLGDAFDKTGMVVTATYKDGTTKAVTNYTLSMETRKSDSRGNKRDGGYGLDYLYPERNDEKNTIDISYTEDGVTATTNIGINTYIYPDQVVKYYAVTNYYDVYDISDINWSATTHYFGIYGDYRSYDNDDSNTKYGCKYTVGSNYILSTSTNKNYICVLKYDFYTLITDGSYWDSGYYEKDRNYVLTRTNNVSYSGGTAIWLSDIDNNASADGQNTTLTVDELRPTWNMGVACNRGTCTIRHTMNSIKVSGKSYPIVVEAGF